MYYAIGVSVPSLYRESTDSLIYMYTLLRIGCWHNTFRVVPGMCQFNTLIRVLWGSVLGC